MKDLFIENFHGIRQVNAVTDLVTRGQVSASICRNVELKYTESAGHHAIFSARGNKAVADLEEKIVGQFESVQNSVRYRFLYTVSGEKGALYVWPQGAEKPEKLDVELSASDVCNGITIAQGYNDWFVFTNGKDDYLGVCMALETAEERVCFLNAYDAEDRDIRGLPLAVQDGRLVTASENRVHWSAQANIFDWSSSDPELVTIPAYQEFDRPVTALSVYNNTLVVFTADQSVSFSGNPSDPTNFTRTGATGGGCAAYRALIKFDNKLFYYDHKARNVFAYYLLDSGQTRPSAGYADDVLSYLTEVSTNRLDEIEVVGVVGGEKSEIWFKLPLEERNLILIYDYLKHEWTERQAQDDITAFCLFNDSLYSASGSLVLKENIGQTFNGVFYPAEYKTTLLNLGSDSKIKVPKMPLILTLDWAYDNDFFMEFTYDDNTDRTIVKHIVKLMQGYLIWSKNPNDPDGGSWALDENDTSGGIWVSSDKNTVMFNLDGILPFKQLQIRIYTTETPQEFAIRRLEFKRVRTKTKSLG